MNTVLDVIGRTLLHLSAERLISVEVMQLFLQQPNVNVNPLAIGNRTPLDCLEAAVADTEEQITTKAALKKLLLEKGAKTGAQVIKEKNELTVYPLV